MLYNLAQTWRSEQVDNPPTVDESRRWLEEALALLGEQRRRLRALVDLAEQQTRRRLAEEEEVAQHLARVRWQLQAMERLQQGANAGEGLAEARLRAEERQLAEQQRALLAEAARLRASGRRVELALQHTAAAATCLAASPEGTPPVALSLEQHTLAVQEEERYRLARDIHDGPAQVLANAVLEMQYIERLLQRDPQAARAELVQLEESLRDGLAEVRRLIFDLRPPALVDLGLVASLQRYVQDFRERTGLAVQLAVGELAERLPAAQEVAVFRIIQEALQNVRKHARASKVAINVARTPAGLTVSVTDDGVGFDPTCGPSAERKTVGLAGMQERAQLIGGALQVVSQPGNGTTISLVVPQRQGEV